MSRRERVTRALSRCVVGHRVVTWSGGQRSTLEPNALCLDAPHVVTLHSS